MIKEKVAVMVLSYNTQKPNFEKVVFGTSPGEPGRLVAGVAVAIREQAEKLIIAMGALGKDGRPGSIITADFLFRNIWQLHHFRCIRWAMIKTTVSDPFEMEMHIEGYLKKITEPFVSRVGTRFKFRDSAEDLYNQGFNRIIIVTSPDHMPRAMRDAFVEWPNPPFELEFVPSATLYSEGDGETPPERASMDNVVVLEPPSPAGPLAKKMLSANPETLAKIGEFLK